MKRDFPKEAPFLVENSRRELAPQPPAYKKADQKSAFLSGANDGARTHGLRSHNPAL